MWLVAGCFATVLSACSPDIQTRGYIAKPGAFDQIRNGMPKTEVEAILGSPSTTASIKYNGDSYYYITSVTEGRPMNYPKEISREVIAIRFDQSDMVQSFGQYTLEDGRVVALNDNSTPVVGEDLSILQNIFRILIRLYPAADKTKQLPAIVLYCLNYILLSPGHQLCRHTGNALSG